jgi:hypothetical protein
VRSNGRTVWLWWWLGVLVAGCAPAAFSGSSTHAPTAPLLSLTLPFGTPTPILRLLRTPTLRATGVFTVTRVISTALPVTINPPNCYETPVGSQWCLGLVQNGLSVTVGQIIIRLYLVNADGTAVAEQEVTLSRPFLLPGESAPYGVRFNSIPEGNIGPVAAVVRANKAADNNGVSLKTQDVHLDVHDAVYRVSGKIINPATQPVQQLAVVATLFDKNGRVTGFREMRFAPETVIAPGASLLFELDAIAQGLGTVRVEATATGRLS